MLTKLLQQITTKGWRYASVMLMLCLLQVIVLRQALAETTPPINIQILNGHAGGYYEQFVTAFEQALRKHAARENIDIHLNQVLIEDNFSANNATDVYVTVGAKAAIALLESGTQKPAVYTLLPKQTFQQIKHWHQPENTWYDAVFIDYPAGLFMDLIKEAMPDKQEVGVILGPDSKHQAAALMEKANQLGLKVAIEYVQNEDEVITALRALRDRMQVFLALPDKHVHNRRTAKTILLSTYRYNIPVVAYSQAYVKAGALTGMYVNPDDLAGQAARVLIASLKKGAARNSCSQQPDSLSIDINASVARLLARDIPEANVLERRMQRYLPKCSP